MSTTNLTLNRKSLQRQPKCRSRLAIRCRWTARLELLRRLLELKNSELLDQSIRALTSRSRREVNLALDALLFAAEVDYDNSDQCAGRDASHLAYPLIGEEPFNADLQDIEDAWQ